MTVTFFGHREIYEKYDEKLLFTIENLIINYGADTFYIGHQSDFDATAYRILKNLKEKYSFLKFSIVLAYFPKNKPTYEFFDYADAFFPEVLDNTFSKYAIDKRNKWMVDISDIVITFVKRNYGGAAKFKEYAQYKNKTVINIAD